MPWCLKQLSNVNLKDIKFWFLFCVYKGMPCIIHTVLLMLSCEFFPLLMKLVKSISKCIARIRENQIPDAPLDKSNTARVNVGVLIIKQWLRLPELSWGSLTETGDVFIISTISAKSHNLVFGILKPLYPRIQNAIDEMNYIEELGHCAARVWHLTLQP